MKGKTKRDNGSGAVAESQRGTPDPEVLERPQRRRFSAEYKRRIVEEAEAAREPGDIGALLRREGLYSSHLVTWRRDYREGARRGLSEKRRGPRSRKPTPEQRRIADLERENRRLRRRLEQAETILEIQKKASEILGIPLKDPNGDESDDCER